MDNPMTYCVLIASVVIEITFLAICHRFHGWKTRFASLHLWAPSFEDGQNQPRTPPFQRPAIADWRKEITLTWGRIQYPAMSAFEGASMPYSDQVKENSESMGKEGEKMVKEK